MKDCTLLIMFSRAFCIAFALGVISVASGLVREPRSAYEVALKCTKAGWNADVSALRKDGSPDLLGDACIYLREFARCLIEEDPADYSSPVPNIVHFLAAYEWQHNYIAEKAGLCQNLPVGELKKIAEQSEIMRIENLKNVEKDKYEQCVGDAMRKCMIRAETLMKQGISQDFLAAITDYITCYEEAGYNCAADMLHHFIAVMKAYRKRLEEKHGEYGKLVDKIPLPPQ